MMQINDFKISQANMDTTTSMHELTKATKRNITDNGNNNEASSSKLMSEILETDAPTTKSPNASTNIVKGNKLLQLRSDEKPSLSKEVQNSISKLFDNLKNGKVDQNSIKDNISKILDTAGSNLGLIINKYA
jgi:hypothetical protein